MKVDYFMAVHVKTMKGGMQGQEIGIRLSYYNTKDDFVLLNKIIKNRKIDKPFQIIRTAGKDEFETESHQYRIGFLCYGCWDKLIKDEKKYVANQKWFESLEKLKKQYPQFVKSENDEGITNDRLL